MENTPLSDRIFKSLSGQVIVLRKRIIAAALAAMLALTAGCGKKEEKTPTTESGIEWKIAGGKVAAGVEEAAGVPKNAVFGTEDDPDIEAVLNFGADLILVDKVSGNYQDMISLLDMTEGAPPYLVIDIHSFDDYADSMLEMAKYTKDNDGNTGPGQYRRSFRCDRKPGCRFCTGFDCESDSGVCLRFWYKPDNGVRLGFECGILSR